MKLLFHSIHIENFMSLGYVDLKLEDRGYIIVSGINNNPNDFAKSNGSGKSSIFDAIMWGLTGETIRGNKDIVNIHGDDGAVVSLHFTVDGKSYRIIRSKNNSIWKTNLKIYIDDDDFSGKGIRDSEKLLKEYLPDLTHQLISSVILLGQGLPNRFTNNSPSGRKDVLERLCKSDFMIEDLKEKISLRKVELQTALRETEDSILVLDTKINLSQNNIDAVKSKLTTTEDPQIYDNKIEELNNKIQYEQGLIHDYTTSLESARRDESKITSNLAELSKQRYIKLSSIHDVYDPQIDTIRLSRANAQAALQAAVIELKKQESIIDICPTCGQKLLEVHKPDPTIAKEGVARAQEELEKWNVSLDELQGKAQKELQEAEIEFIDQEKEINIELREIKHLVKSLEENIALITSTITGMQKSLQQLQVTKAAAEEFLSTANQTIAENEATIKSAQEELLYKNTYKENLSARISIINKFNVLITREFRGYLLATVIEFINKKAKEYCKDIFETELIDFSLDGNNISITYDNKEYESLSGGEKQKVDLIIQFSIRDMLCSYIGFSTNIIVLDEIFDNLDDIGCEKIISLISRKLSDISSIFIITHHGSELNIPCDDELIVIKDSNGVSSLK